MSPAHPGKVTFVDGALEKVLPVGEVPEAVAFAREGEALVPVVKVVALAHGDRRELKSYGVDGRLLSVTYQRRSA
jgi:hypothetical protein